MDAVVTRDLTKIYSNGVKALDRVDLNVKEGLIFAVLGPNGAGKTTLIRILTTQIRPSSGSAYVLGHDVVEEGSRVREVIGYVPQEFSVWNDLTGYENLVIYSKLYGVERRERGRVIREVLDLMGLSDAANRLVRTYSGGMIRRLEIGCALLKRPRVLFLDEPTVGLDPATRHLIWAKLSELKRQGTTIFFSTHYMDEAEQYADEVALINRGRIVVKGTVEALKRDVGSNSIVLEVDNADKAAEALRGIGGEVLLDKNRVVVLTDMAEEMLPELVIRVYRSGLHIKKIYVKNVTLDDVFMKYVGEVAESGDLISARVVRRAIKKA
ncbi:MAG: ATP-binding cassette domain-containing protein [Thermoproteus sp.]